MMSLRASHRTLGRGGGDGGEGGEPSMNERHQVGVYP